ncbi:MAG: 16S rRNA (guanine(966)-N(2))-methyltransferase RsmD [Armatimonadetes bacterium RBG_16_67_12]|nr:MAG: 16S rRNA (guanine(966)-N(2))-methyltransferase RsmD [Armatimonadetes bacterium RBG_16_67_12]
MKTRRTAASPARLRGRRALRPTSSRVKTALFDSLADAVRDAVVLDLFAGTGALGIEALHRGARQAVFVERDPSQCRTLRRALDRAGLAERGDVRRGDILPVLDHLGRAGGVFDLVLLDPPYGQGWIERTLRALAHAGILRPDGLVVAEGHWRDRPTLAPGWRLAKEARYGETALWYIRIESDQ